MDPMTLKLIFALAEEGISLYRQATDIKHVPELAPDAQRDQANVAALVARARLLQGIVDRVEEANTVKVA